MRLQLTRDAERFAAQAEGFLAARAERNVLATVLLRARHARADVHAPLLTDLANPTSNKIYASVGFERFGTGRITSSSPPSRHDVWSRPRGRICQADMLA
jgi:hypothetical protein